MEFIQLTIRDYKSLVKRGDIRSPTWFAVEHNLLLHPDFFDLSGDEVKAYLWICGTATHLNMPTIRAYPDLCSQQIGISKKSFHSSVRKLNGKRWDVTDTNGSVRILPGNIENACPTVQDSTGQDTTVQDSTGQGLSKGFHPLIEIWNANCGSLPKVISFTGSRKKLAEKEWGALSAEDWLLVVQKMALSEFCCGLTDKGAWKASFDWMLKTKKDNPPNYLKVLEGNYDNVSTKNKPSSIYKSPENLAWANTITESGADDEQ